MKYDYKSIKILFLFIALINANGWLLEADAQMVNFPDANLAAAVRFHLGFDATDSLTETALTRLTFLSANDVGIRDLTGLQAAINLRTLGLRGNQISDISALSGLTSLQWLGLSDNQISDISALSGLTNLQTLSLPINQISDISALSGLTKLQWLSLEENQISDISALSGLTNLQTLSLASQQISDISALSGLTNLQTLDLAFNSITDLNPLSNLSNLEKFYIDAAFDEKNPGVLRRIIPENAQIFFSYPNNPRGAVTIAREELTRKRVSQHCGVGWSPYGHSRQHPKVMIYALEFEYRKDPRSRYICSAIEIRAGNPTRTHLDGWKLYFGTLYNQSRTPIELTQTNSQITDGVLRLTPEMLGLESLACRNAYVSGQTLPSVHYVLKNEKNRTIDTAYSCFRWGQVAVPLASPRRLSSQTLQAMKTPRIERYIIDPNSVSITYMDFDDFQWDRPVLSDWLLAASQEMEVAGGNAPSYPNRKLTTSWAALKKSEIHPNNEKRR